MLRIVKLRNGFDPAQSFCLGGRIKSSRLTHQSLANSGRSRIRNHETDLSPVADEAKLPCFQFLLDSNGCCAHDLIFLCLERRG